MFGLVADATGGKDLGSERSRAFRGFGILLHGLVCTLWGSASQLPLDKQPETPHMVPEAQGQLASVLAPDRALKRLRESA